MLRKKQNKWLQGACARKQANRLSAEGMSLVKVASFIRKKRGY